MSSSPEITLIIPTWNNLDYLKFCLDSLQRNCRSNYQVVLHINDGSDGTLDWARESGFDFTHTEKNVGICHGVNYARTKACGRYLMYLNDDMYACPEMDIKLLAEAKRLEKLGEQHFMISATMIEASYSRNICAIVADYGNTPGSFRETDLISDLAKLERDKWSGSTWPPVLLPATTWDIAGGFSIEFSPGMYSDPDLSMKLWQMGCREFVGLGDAFVYHFPSKSTGRVKKNDGRRQFRKKWGISASTFCTYMLRRGQPYAGALRDPDPSIGYKLAIMANWLQSRLD